jgi:tRNA threonylcarbamoyladenosine biosynthesis protein TsaB
MMLLAIDTSTRHIGVALYDGEQVRHEAVWVSRNNHTVELAPAIREALAVTGQGVAGLEAVGVATGPGSYTGLRIGMAMAKGLALSCSLPLIGIPTLDVLVASQPVCDEPLAAVLQAGRGRLSVGWYQVVEGSWQPDGEHQVVTPQELYDCIDKPTVICGELTTETRQLLRRKFKNALLASPAQSLRRPSFLAELAWSRWQDGELDDPAVLAPTYLQVGEPIPG